MILIIGSTKDDTLYFDSVVTHKREENHFLFVILSSFLIMRYCLLQNCF